MYSTQTEALASQMIELIRALADYLDQGHRSDVGPIDMADLVLAPRMENTPLPPFGLNKYPEGVYIWLANAPVGTGKALQEQLLVGNLKNFQSLILLPVGHKKGGKFVLCGPGIEPQISGRILPDEVPEGALVVFFVCALSDGDKS